MKTWRSIVSLLLVLVFALELLPLSSFAVESNDLTKTEAVETAQPKEQSATDTVSTDEPYVVSEVEELREEAVKHFRMSDGSFLAVQYGTPVHYKDESDQWQEIDNSLTPENGKLVTKYGDVEKTFSQTLSDGKLFDVKVGDFSLGMSLMSPGGKSGDVVMAAEDSEQAELPTTAQEAEQTEEVTEEHADEQSAESAEVAEIREDNKASKGTGTADSADIEAYENTEAKEKVTPAPVEPSEAPTPVEDSVMRVVAAPSIKATVESKAPMRVNASERLTAEKLVARELSTAEVFYANALQSVDLNYQSTTNSVKESIIIKAPPSSYSYSFLLTLTGVTPKLQDDGSITCSAKDGKIIFVIPAPFMIDAAGAVSLDAKYALEKADGDWVLTVTADAEWLNAQERVFPVTLDPTTEYKTNVYHDTLPITYVVEGTPNTTHVKPSILSVGYGDSSSKRMEIFMGVRDQLSLPYNSEVINAAILMFQSSYFGTDRPSINITAHQVTGTPSYSDYSDWMYNMTWNNKPAYGSDILDHFKVSAGTTGVYLDITRAAKAWFTDSSVPRAIALSAYNLPDSSTAVSNLWGYSGTTPTLYVTYRNNVGLENYFTYQAFDVGNAGTAYIADHSGYLTVLTPLVSFASTSNPFTLDLVYNSSMDFPLLDPTLNVKTSIGKGMSLNIIQEIRPHLQGLLYTDGDGTQHYFAHDSSMGGNDMYFDEEGLGLKIKEQDQSTYILSDDDGNQWTFTNHYLSVMQDGNGNQYEIHYVRGDGDTTDWHPFGSNDLLDCVVQKNTNGSAITVATFSHDSKGLLTSVTDYAGRTVTFNYSTFVYTSLVSVSRNGSQLASFQYTGRLTEIKDGATNCGLSLTYDDKAITSFHFLGSGTQNVRETTSIVHDGNRTTYTTGDVSTTYLFDSPGRTVNAYTTQNDYLVGAANAVYTGIGDTSRMMNRTMQAGEIGVTAHSWMRNGNFENTSAFSWTLTGAGGTNTNIVINGDKTHTGNYALKGWLAANANGTTTASHQTYSLRNDLKYAASAYVYTHDVSEFGTNGCIKLEVLNSSGTVIATDSIDYKTSLEIDNGWTRLSTSFQASGIVTVRISAVNARGFFYADDVQVEPAAPGTPIAAPSNVNLIDNGNLQYYNSGWVRNNVNYANDVGRCAETTGAYSLCALGALTASRTAYQNVPINLPGSETYILSGWAKAQSIYTGEGALHGVLNNPAEDDGKRFGLCAELAYTDGTKEYHYSPFNPDLTEWQFTSITIVPKNAKNPDDSYKTVASIKVSCIYNNNVGTAYFDDFSLVRKVAQTMKYDPDGNLESVTSTGAKADQNSFTNGKLIQTITAENRSLTYSYENSNNSHLITKISDGAVQDSFAYDTRGNITLENYSNSVGSAPIRQKYEYSTDGNRLSKSTVFGNYSDANSPNQVVTNYYYNTAYNIMSGQPSKVSSFHTTVESTYDTTYNRTTQVTQQNAGTLAYSYSNGNLDSLTRTNYTGGSSQTYSFAYNAFGDRTLSTVGGIPLASYSYNNTNGNLESLTYGNGAVTSYSYDPLYRLTNKTTTTNGNSRTTQYVYNGNGDLYEQLDSGGETLRYRYDSLNRLAGLRRSGFNRTLNTAYQYDDCGRLRKYSYEIANLFSGSEAYEYRTTSDSTGAAGAVSKITFAPGDIVEYTYDALHRLNNRRIGGSIKESYSYATSYDGSTPLSTTMVDAKAIRDLNSSDAILHRWQYAYDRAGNIVTETDSASNQSTTYTYDDQNQLTKAVTPSTTYTYSYDQAGNLQTAKIGNTTHTYTYGNSGWKDLLTAYDGHTITYDAIGNPLSYYNGNSIALTWTEGRRLNTARRNNITTTYSYDSDGFRTRKVFSVGGRIDYYWDNGRLVGEARYTILGIATNYIQYHYDESGSPIGFTNNGTDFYYAKNLQGDVVAIYEKLNNNGTITTSCVARYEYDPWGKCTVKTADGRNDILSVSVGHINPFRFKGYYYDNETKFYYLQSRYYDPAIGRFINADVLASTGQGFNGCNMFAYCGNNPVNRYDPTGGIWVQVGMFALGATLGGLSAYMSGGDAVDIAEAAFFGGLTSFAGGEGLARNGIALLGGLGSALVTNKLSRQQDDSPLIREAKTALSFLPVFANVRSLSVIFPSLMQTTLDTSALVLKNSKMGFGASIVALAISLLFPKPKHTSPANLHSYFKMHVVPITIRPLQLNIVFTYQSRPYSYRPTYYSFDFSTLDAALAKLSVLS